LCHFIGLYIRNVFGLSGVRALPLAAGINDGGHYFRYFPSSCSCLILPPLFKTPEGVVVGFHIYAWASAHLGAMTPIGASGIIFLFTFQKSIDGGALYLLVLFSGFKNINPEK
jgi:hypothetical protein